MPSAPSEAGALPPLAPLSAVSRPLSAIEYYHYSIGAHPRTLEPPRDVVFVLEARNELLPSQWQRALDAAAAANPGARLRLHGHRRAARWKSDGPGPRLRVVEDCIWDGQSGQGSEFIFEPPLALRDGPVVELIVAYRRSGGAFVILRSHHAIMDGSGGLHFLKEVFRALRGEALLGSNAAYSDADLLCSLGVTQSESKHIETGWLTGPPRGDAQGDDWRRIALGRPRPNLLGHVAAAMAAFAHRYSDLPALIAIPVDLRRHVPGLVSTGNFSSMLLVRVERGEGADQFRERLQRMLAARMEAAWSKHLDWFKLLPPAWIDRLLSRTAGNYRKKKPKETAVISNLGRVDPAEYGAPGFEMQNLFVLPLAGSAFSTLVCTGDRVELTLNLPRLLSSDGRFDAFVEFLHERLAQPAPPSAAARAA
ncbi:hypothetical protein [Solimonas soli]|uniref:hypothetical protein n=1 Tax=Solimonas soli TaxID=413479 RepID=UPI0004850AA4|nr:hypothetical protein [Solimonas soli]